MNISAFTTIRCLFLGHRFETHLIRCNGSHFICRKCGMHIWRSAFPNEGDVIREFREGTPVTNKLTDQLSHEEQ